MTILYDIYLEDLNLLDPTKVTEEFMIEMETINWEVVKSLLDIEEHIKEEEVNNPDAYILVHLKRDPVAFEVVGYSKDLTQAIFSSIREHSDAFKLMVASLISINRFREN